MNVRATLTAILTLAAVGFTADSAMAERVKLQTQKQVKAGCGGVYFPPSGAGVYGCMNNDGSGIVCGGVTQAQKNSCDTFLKVPPRLPTRSEIELAEKAKILF